MPRLCERPGCSTPAEVAYGFDAESLVVWLDAYEANQGTRSGGLCRRHADAMVVPLGWMLDDRREPVPRLFSAARMNDLTDGMSRPRLRRPKADRTLELLRSAAMQLQLDDLGGGGSPDGEIRQIGPAPVALVTDPTVALRVAPLVAVPDLAPDVAPDISREPAGELASELAPAPALVTNREPDHEREQQPAADRPIEPVLAAPSDAPDELAEAVAAELADDVAAELADEVPDDVPLRSSVPSIDPGLRIQRAVAGPRDQQDQQDLPDQPAATVEDQGPDAQVLPWQPRFDQQDDLSGLLKARGRLLSRAFRGVAADGA